jgi:hypothetical protein
MKRLIRIAARLYPRSWQERYGAEFAALLEDVNPDWRTSVDILKGALEMQTKTWNFGKIFLAAGLAGVLAAAGVWFGTPKKYASQAVLGFGGLMSWDDAGQVLFEAARRAESRDALLRIVTMDGLYQGEREKMPITDVIERMKRSIRIAPISGTPAFFIEFAYEDASKAQQATQDLAASFMRENANGSARVYLKILDEPKLPQKPISPNHWLIAMAGVGTGGAVALALILALRLRVARTGSNGCK